MWKGACCGKRSYILYFEELFLLSTIYCVYQENVKEKICGRKKLKKDGQTVAARQNSTPEGKKRPSKYPFYGVDFRLDTQYNVTAHLGEPQYAVVCHCYKGLIYGGDVKYDQIHQEARRTHCAL